MHAQMYPHVMLFLNLQIRMCSNDWSIDINMNRTMKSKEKTKKRIL